jgi:hypothetical protein
MPDPLQKRRITDKILLLWELNPTWSIGYVIDQVHFSAEASTETTELAIMSDNVLEEALDYMIEKSKEERGERP